MLIILCIIIIVVLLLLYLTKTITKENFYNDGYVAACTELTNKRNFLYLYLQYLRSPVQDLSNTLINTSMAKDENMSFQYKLKYMCKAIINVPAGDNCKGLVNVDAGTFEILPDIDIFYQNLLYSGVDIDGLYITLNNYSSALGCSAKSTSGGLINSIDLSSNHLSLDSAVGVVDTETLALNLERLSPYWLSPDVVRYLIRFLISQEQLGNLHETSAEYLATETQLVHKIVSKLTPPLVEGQSYSCGGAVYRAMNGKLRAYTGSPNAVEWNSNWSISDGNTWNVIPINDCTKYTFGDQMGSVPSTLIEGQSYACSGGGLYRAGSDGKLHNYGSMDNAYTWMPSWKTKTISAIPLSTCPTSMISPDGIGPNT